MPDTESLLKLLALIGGVIAVLKVGWAIAQFFVGLAKGLESLTAAVKALTDRFDEHARDITDGLSDVRERVVKLETWREATE